MIKINEKMPSLEMKELKNKTKRDIETLAAQFGVDLQYEERVLKDKGWVGQQKGLLQVLWERGWINDSLPVNKHYTVNGRKDRYGNILMGTNLRQIMEACLDFINERTLLQESMYKLGVTVHQSPKYHCEVAGEGIKYSWGFSKNQYRCLSMSAKKTKEKFWQSVWLVTSQTSLNKNAYVSFQGAQEVTSVRITILHTETKTKPLSLVKTSHLQSSNAWSSSLKHIVAHLILNKSS